MKTLRDCDAYFVFCFGFIALDAFEQSLYSPYTYEKRIFSALLGLLFLLVSAVPTSTTLDSCHNEPTSSLQVPPHWGSGLFSSTPQPHHMHLYEGCLRKLATPLASCLVGASLKLVRWP